MDKHSPVLCRSRYTGFNFYQLPRHSFSIEDRLSSSHSLSSSSSHKKFRGSNFPPDGCKSGKPESKPSLKEPCTDEVSQGSQTDVDTAPNSLRTKSSQVSVSTQTVLSGHTNCPSPCETIDVSLYYSPEHTGVPGFKSYTIKPTTQDHSSVALSNFSRSSDSISSVTSISSLESLSFLPSSTLPPTAVPLSSDSSISHSLTDEVGSFPSSLSVLNSEVNLYTRSPSNSPLVSVSPSVVTSTSVVVSDTPISATVSPPLSTDTPATCAGYLPLPHAPSTEVTPSMSQHLASVFPQLDKSTIDDLSDYISILISAPEFDYSPDAFSLLAEKIVSMVKSPVSSA